jgi:hypothetical protein
MQAAMKRPCEAECLAQPIYGFENAERSRGVIHAKGATRRPNRYSNALKIREMALA